MANALAPIILFAHARPEHTRRTLGALAENVLAIDSDLWVYADAARSETEVERVRDVRAIAHGAKGFRSVTVVERETNLGLARNIIEGVTAVCNAQGRVIVLEDDIVTGRNFLSFMNAALDRYADEPRVWHVSGWNYPIDPADLGDAFLWRVMNCWGWATWADRWQHFRKEPAHLVEAWDKETIARFNLDGAHDFWEQVEANRKGLLNTWAIFWYASIFEHQGLCLNPARSFVHNIGHDGSGENCGYSVDFSISRLGSGFEGLPASIEESALAVHRVKAFYQGMRRPFLQRIVSYVRNLAPARTGYR